MYTVHDLAFRRKYDKTSQQLHATLWHSVSQTEVEISVSNDRIDRIIPNSSRSENPSNMS